MREGGTTPFPKFTKTHRSCHGKAKHLAKQTTQYQRRLPGDLVNDILISEIQMENKQHHVL